MEDFLNPILGPLKELARKFQVFVPNFLAMLVILLIGFLLAFIIKRILLRFLAAINFDSWSDRKGFTKLMRKGDMWSKPSAALATIVFGLLIIVTLMGSLSALHIAAIDHLVEQFFSYIPRILSAAVIMIVGYVLSGFVSRTVLIAAANSGFHYAKILAETIYALLILLILAMVMEQLQIAPGIVLAAFSIIFGGIVIALAIAFGVGGIDAARRIIERESTAKSAEEAKDEIEHI
ncbi:MAG: mechanosensitive ion channel family protein [Gallionellaceae bacterium]